MARVIHRKRPLSKKEIVSRSTKYRVFRYGVWIDPFPEVKGTRPEKMVYAALVARGIPFDFQKWWRPNFELESNEWYRPDFFLPGLNIVIEVQGAYFHSKPEQIASDAFKQALYAMSGYKCLAWWDYDIETRLDALFAENPELAWRNARLSYLPQNASGIDDTLGMAKQNEKKRKPWTKKAVSVKIKKGRKTRNVRRSYTIS